MKLSAEITAFMHRLGHQFSRPDLLVRALTHGSVVTAQKQDNQRLEFLGDRVLGLVMAEALYFRDRDAAEGQLAPRFNALVRGETCAEVARQIDLGAVLRLGQSEMKSGGRRKEAILADAMEAVIAAVYLDAGHEVARRIVLDLWGERLDHAEENAREAKTELQEWAQGHGMPPPVYEVTDRKGPDHAPVFTIRVTLADGRSASASGSGTKRNIERAAARDLLSRIEDKT